MNHLGRLLGFGAVVMAFTPADAAAVDAFFLQRLQEGTQAYERRDYRAATDALRLAAFGMLDDPALLGGTLVRLATAQAAAGDGAGFQATFGRLLEVEQRFSVYSGLSLEPELRASFEQHARKRIASAVLEATPAFHDLVAPKTKAQEAPDRPEPRSGGRNVSPAAARPSEAELEALRRAEEQMNAATHQVELGAALAAAQPVADAWPAYRPAQLLAGEVAYRASRWREAAAYLERAAIRPASDSAACFHWAVSLYETGESERAAAVLEPCVRFLERTPLVTQYLARILPAAAP